MAARALPLLFTGIALLITGCSGAEGGSAAPASSGATTPPAPPAPATSTTSASASASTSAQQPTSARPTASPQRSGSDKSAAGAIARYETYLHAVGKEDLATACEIAAPAAKKAEDEGFGPCESTFPIMFRMISAAQKRALQSATVNQGGTSQSGSAKIEIPAKAVQAAVRFTDSDLGDATLEYRGNQWYVTD